MSGQHTPAPWQRIDTPDYAEIHPIGSGDGPPIALVANPADADLFVAAPDLLEALKQLLATVECGTALECPLCDAARAAIAKAESRS
jgi:hypothetical protein